MREHQKHVMGCEANLSSRTNEMMPTKRCFRFLFQCGIPTVGNRNNSLACVLWMHYAAEMDVIHWKKNGGHFDLKSWVTGGTKIRPEDIWVKLTLNIKSIWLKCFPITRNPGSDFSSASDSTFSFSVIRYCRRSASNRLQQSEAKYWAPHLKAPSKKKDGLLFFLCQWGTGEFHA